MPSLTSPRSWTLRSKLVASMVALFLAVSIGTGTLIVIATQDYLSRQVDEDLKQTVARTEFDDHKGGSPRGGPGGPLPGGGAGVLTLALDSSGQVIHDPRDDDPLSTAVDVNGNTVTLTAAQITTLKNADIGEEPQTVDLGAETGTYRVMAVTSGSTTLIKGVPTLPVTKTVNQLLGLVAAGTILGLALVGLGGTYLVRRNLAPLDRVAGTARAVSQLSLESGEVALAERVPAADTDPNTEVGQVGLALNSMLDNVDGALRARQESETRVRQFVADASHELRTPLASIRGYAELSRREREPVPQSVTHALGRIESESLRMQGLVEDLLLLARLDAGRPLDHDPVDLTLLAIDAVSDARAASPEHVWALDLPDEPVEVPGDRARLHQVLVNLLGNARAHTPAGTRVVTSLRRGSADDPTRTDVITLSVTDNGPGIPEALQPNVFQRFTRGDEARNRAAGSTGLGLSIVAAVTSAHRGRVGLRSRPGETSFVVELPAA
ncbi:sensor histidine kinase [Nostocoides australiense]